MLGRGAPTSPGHFRNTAHPIARPTARNRAIAHTNAPSNAGRSRPDHHAPDIHGAGTERAAQTPGRELLDVLTDDQHSGPRRKRPQFAHHEASYSRQRRGRDHRLERQPLPAQPAGSRRGRRAAAWLLSTRASVLPQILSQARATANGQDGCGARGLRREARHAATARSSSPGAASASAGWPDRRPLRSGRGPDGEHGQHHGRTTQRRSPTAARHVR